MTVTDVHLDGQYWGVRTRGPNILAPLTDADLSNEAFPFGTIQEIDLGYPRVHGCRRTYMGERGWELYVPTEFALGAFDTSGGPVDREAYPGRLPRMNRCEGKKGPTATGVTTSPRRTHHCTLASRGAWPSTSRRLHRSRSSGGPA
ncbi:MAG: hypothetical protein Ct9H300mP12_12100 [Acidimicrobiales bacterium]|nr:MAG: hypothetical protein Ct9H300mP12_12100 [Acidimicrobiales bacterium]